MRATVYNGPGDVSVESVDDPGVTTPHGAVIEVTHSAICGSDLHIYHGVTSAPGTRPGHEFVGRIVEVGADVRRHRPGDPVLVSGVIGCGTCDPCLRGWVVGCRNAGLAVFGTSPALPGGQAEYVEVPHADRFAHPMAPDLDPEAAVMLTDILPTGYLGARRADITPGDTVLVVGLGPVGMFALQAAQLFGAARVLAADTVPGRLARAEALGAEPIDAAAGTPAQVMELTKGVGADAAIEAVGSDATVNDAVMAVRAGATVSVVGVNATLAMPYPMMLALLRDITLRATLASVPSTWPALLPLVAGGRIRPQDVVTHRLPLSQAPDAYRRFDAREDGVLKVLLDPRS